MALLETSITWKGDGQVAPDGSVAVWAREETMRLIDAYDTALGRDVCHWSDPPECAENGGYRWR
jgi:hypothetical protein